MLINPIIVIAATAILLCVLIYCVINKPTKPIFTGVSIGMLILFLVMSTLLNIGMGASIGDPSFTKAITGIVSFLTAQGAPTSNQLENSFFVYSMIDIALIVISVVSMFIEVRRIFSFNNKK